MTTVRLPVELEQKLDVMSRNTNYTKSELIKDALEGYFVHEASAKDSYQAGELYFGRYGSKKGDLSVQYKNHLKEKLDAKFRTH